SLTGKGTPSGASQVGVDPKLGATTSSPKIHANVDGTAHGLKPAPTEKATATGQQILTPGKGRIAKNPAGTGVISIKFADPNKFAGTLSGPGDVVLDVPKL